MEWDGNDFRISGIFNQPLEDYNARNGFMNCCCAAEVNHMVKKEDSYESFRVVQTVFA